MPTIPAAGVPHPAPESHTYRQVAESFGIDPERYDRARPRYPAGLVDRVVAASPGRDLLDVGCGTGIAARQFRAAGCHVLGVEPDARMAEFARRTGIEVEAATFEAWDPAGRRFDAVVAGQAWHWVDPVAGAAKAASVLRPGGQLVLFWNVFQPPPEVAEAFAAAYRQALPDSPFSRQAAPAPAAPGGAYSVFTARAGDGIRKAGGFGEPEQWQAGWEQAYTRDEWLDVLPTTGTLTQAPPDKLAQVLAGVGAAIDALGGSVTVRYTTVAVFAARSAAA